MGVQSMRRKVLNFLQTKEFETLVRTAVQGFSESLLQQRKIGQLNSYLTTEMDRALKNYVFERVMAILSEEVPKLVDIVDISVIVEEKINSFHVREVEDIVEGIMHDHFRYINYFGAFLGALIGLLNVLLVIWFI